MNMMDYLKRGQHVDTPSIQNPGSDDNPLTPVLTRADTRVNLSAKDAEFLRIVQDQLTLLRIEFVNALRSASVNIVPDLNAPGLLCKPFFFASGSLPANNMTQVKTDPGKFYGFSILCLANFFIFLKAYDALNQPNIPGTGEIIINAVSTNVSPYTFLNPAGTKFQNGLWITANNNFAEDNTALSASVTGMIFYR